MTTCNSTNCWCTPKKPTLHQLLQSDEMREAVARGIMSERMCNQGANDETLATAAIQVILESLAKEGIV